MTTSFSGERIWDWRVKVRLKVLGCRGLQGIAGNLGFKFSCWYCRFPLRVVYSRRVKRKIMVTRWKKCRRASAEQAWPRGGNRKSRNREFFESPESPSSSSSSPSYSPPTRRRDALKTFVVKIVRPRSSIEPETKNYRGVRYREELNKYVTEIRPARSTKKIWLGTYDTAEEAARAFDIGNLCCEKNLPLNFQDSPRMLRKISSRLSPDEARNAIAKLAKEVARVVSLTVSSDTGAVKRKEVDRAAAEKAIELFEQKAEEPILESEPESMLESEPEPMLESEPEPKTQHLEAGFGSPVCTYTERLEENVVAVIEESNNLVATSVPIQTGGEGGSGGHSWNSNLSRMFFPDDDNNMPLHKLINFGSEYGDVLVHSYP